MIRVEQAPPDRLLPAQTPEMEFPSMRRVMVMDLGSTNWKVAYWEEGESLLLAHAKTNDPTRFTSWHFREIPDVWKISDLPPFKIVEESSLNVFWGKIQDMEDKRGPPDMYVLTGFTNTLAVTFQGKEDKPKTYILLEDPSARTDLTSAQKRAIRDALPDPQIFEKEGLKVASSLTKIAFLQNHPEAVAAMFGDGVTFGELRFSTMRGLVTKWLINRRDRNRKLPKLIPAGGDERSFAGGNVGRISPERMQVLFDDFGVRRGQVNFLKYPMVIHAYGDRGEKQFKIYNTQDFAANAWFLTRTLESESYRDSYVIEFDSVLKIASLTKKDDLAYAGRKTLFGLEYATQRNGTNAINNMGRFLADQHHHLGRREDSWDLYKAIREISAEYKNRRSLSRFLYYPEAGLYGTLVERFGDGSVKKIDPLTDLTYSYNIDEIKEMIASVTCGMAFGIRKKQEDINRLHGIISTRNNLLYGGLVNYDSDSTEIIAQCLAGNVNLLKMSYAGQAAFLQAMDDYGANTAGNFQIDTEKVIHGFKRDDTYQIWQDTEGKIRNGFQ